LKLAAREEWNLAGSGKSGGGRMGLKLSQELVVVAISVILFVVFSATLDNFLSRGNIIAILKNVSILGTLAVGMGFIVVGRGIDLTMVAVMVVGVAFSIWISTWGVDFTLAVVCGAVFAATIGLFTGIMVAVAEIPPIFATLPIASSVYGSGRILFASDVPHTSPDISWLKFVGNGTILGIPMSVVIFAAVAARMGFFLRKTRFGRLVYATGSFSEQLMNLIGTNLRELAN